jgi:CheY-like chemotaxis protein
MKKVLIVEDDEMSMSLQKLFLKTIGIVDLICATNGKEAIQLYKDNMKDIDFILLDIRMPLMDGYEVADEILKIKYVPIIIVSAQSMSGRVDEAKRHGCLDHLCKPHSSKDLEKILRKHNLI